MSGEITTKLIADVVAKPNFPMWPVWTCGHCGKETESTDGTVEVPICPKCHRVDMQSVEALRVGLSAIPEKREVSLVSIGEVFNSEERPPIQGEIARFWQVSYSYFPDPVDNDEDQEIDEEGATINVVLFVDGTYQTFDDNQFPRCQDGNHYACDKYLHNGACPEHGIPDQEEE
jgi:endogenous inhibitor of DNA gyrase (YacG/DUF329 family)